MEFENRVVVIDNGSGVCKVGFAGQHMPTAVFPSIVGHVRVRGGLLSSSSKLYIGEEAFAKKGILNLKYPIEHGVITNWDEMEAIWTHTFANELRVPSSEHPVLLTEPPLNPKANKEKMCSVMFESLEVPSIYIGIQAVLSLYSSAFTTGLVVDIGDGVTHIVPTFEGYTLPHAIQRVNIAGRDITKQLSVLLQARGVRFSTTSEFEICREIKEKNCYIAEDFPKECEKSDHETQVNHQLPDGTFISLAEERFKATEILFRPEIVGIDVPGVSTGVCNSISACDIDVRRELYGNILLSGGSTLFNGFSERLYGDVRSKSNTTAKIKVVAPRERQFSVWIGGSILAALDQFRSLVMTKEEYYESGAAAIHRKCF